MPLLVISCSLNPASKSRILAREAHRVLTAAGQPTAWLDLRDLPLPFCDDRAAYADPNVAQAQAAIGAATGILLAVPIYNYYASAAAKNLIELTGNAWDNKVVGFACAAGGDRSYMSVMALANHLMLDFRCTIVPRFVYALEPDFSAETIVSADIVRRTAELARELTRYGRALGADQ